MLNEYPRIYNLFPRLAGTIPQWEEHIPRIRSMGFNWIWINPIHPTSTHIREDGRSGSLYAARDHFTVDHEFSEYQQRTGASPLEARGADRTALQHFIRQTNVQGMQAMADLVTNHMAVDSSLVKGEDPNWPNSANWFKRDPDGKLHVVRDDRGRWQWDDIAQINWEDAGVRREATEYFKSVIRSYHELGFAGMRCDAARFVPPGVWKDLIHYSRTELSPNMFWLGEFLGGDPKDYPAYKAAGFDIITNSVGFAIDFAHNPQNPVAPWFWEEAQALRQLAPALGFPESHDFHSRTIVGSLGHRANGTNRDAAAMLQLERYILSAFLSDGIMMPMGYEYGLTQAYDVFRGASIQWDIAMRSRRIDLTEDIAEINRAAAANITPGQNVTRRVTPIIPSGSSKPQCMVVQIHKPDGDSFMSVIDTDLEHPHTLPAGRALSAQEVATSLNLNDVLPPGSTPTSFKAPHSNAHFVISTGDAKEGSIARR